MSNGAGFASTYAQLWMRKTPSYADVDDASRPNAQSIYTGVMQVEEDKKEIQEARDA